MVGFPATAYGLCNAAGGDARAVWRTLLAGGSGLRPARDRGGSFGAVELEPSGARGLQLLGRVLEPVPAPVTRACRRWGASRVGAVVATSSGALAGLEAGVRGTALETSHLPGAHVELVARATGLRGPAYALVGGATTGLRALGTALRLLEGDAVDAVVVAAVQAPAATSCRHFESGGWVSAEPCRPWGLGRDGTSLGEGAAFVLLERHGSAFVELRAVAEAGAVGTSTFDPSIQVESLRASLRRGGVAPRDVGSIHLQACGLPDGDAVEAEAVRTVFGPTPRVLTSAAATGHMFAASSLTGVVLAALALREGHLPSAPASPVDPRCWPEPPVGGAVEGDFAVAHAWDLDGATASVVLGVRDR